MLTHNQVWGAVDRIAARYNFSPSGLAKAAGLDPTTFNKSKRVTPDGAHAGPRPNPSPRCWTQPAPISTSSFRCLPRNRSVRRSRAADRICRGRRRRFLRRQRLSGRQRLGRNQAADVDDDHAYALEVSGNSMEPLYRKGDILVVSPAAPLRKGDRVVLKTKDGEVLAKELKKKTVKAVELKSLNPDHRDRTLQMSDVVWIARIVWASQ